MRRVYKLFRPIPKALLDKYKELEQKLIEQKDRHDFKSEVYNATIKKDLDALYHNKCAFCESELNTRKGDNFEYTIEHFRTKSIYWWLGYEWSNLLPICRKCNEEKGDKFDVLPNKRIQQKTPIEHDENGLSFLRLDKCCADYEELRNENIKLIHPEMENPMDFLRFSTEKIGLFMIETIHEEDDKESKHRKYKINNTIDYYKLNREELVLRRRKIYDTALRDLQEQMLELMDIYGNNYPEEALKLAFRRIIKRIIVSTFNEKVEYFSFWNFLLENFDTLFIQKMEGTMQKDILRKAFLLTISDF